MRSRLPALQLEIEITEAVLIDDFEAAPDILRQIRATGVRVSLDAFDTGDPSFGDLRRFPFDRAKINPSWRVPTPSTTDKSLSRRWGPWRGGSA